MSNFIENCRAYCIKIYEKKSGKYYRFSVLAEDKAHAIKLVENYCVKNIGITCKVNKVWKHPNKHQVLDYSEY